MANALAFASVGGTAYGYDGRGNLTADGSRSFAYDLENHLTAVSGSASMTLAYDPLGRLKSTTAAGATTDYLYDGDRLVAEYTGSTLLRRYVHGAGVDEPLVWYEGAGLTDRRWLHGDHQGSVIATSDGSALVDSAGGSAENADAGPRAPPGAHGSRARPRRGHPARFSPPPGCCPEEGSGVGDCGIDGVCRQQRGLSVGEQVCRQRPVERPVPRPRPLPRETPGGGEDLGLTGREHLGNIRP